jgi:hypothetical protein
MGNFYLDTTQWTLSWLSSAQVAIAPWTPNVQFQFAGPDAQANVTHRYYDPFDRRTPNTQYQICNHPYFNLVEELYDHEGTPFDAGGVRTYTRKFRVVATVTTLGPSMVCSCPGIPMPFAPYIPGRALENDMLARAVKISAKRMMADDYKTWIVTVEYSTAMPEGGPSPSSGTNLGWNRAGIQNNPWDEPPHLEWEPEVGTRTPTADLDQKPFVNSAGQPMYPAPAVEDGISVLVITKNARFNSLVAVRDHIERYSFVVNLNSFVGASRGSALSLPPRAVESYRGPLRYWRMTYRIKFKRRDTSWLQGLFPADTWQPKILDAGMYQIRSIWGVPDPNKELIPIFKGNTQVNYPVPLNGKGQPAAPGMEKFISFKYYPEVDFSDIILPAAKL